MGAKYTTNSASGYNSSPPPDDGSQVAANLVTWATHKTKLADPVKTLADDINTDLVAAFDYSVRQITASDNTVAGDHMRVVEIAPTVTPAITVSLGDAATMTNVYRVFVKNSSAINQTVGRVTGGDTIDGVAGNVTLIPGEGRAFQTNAAATGYLTISGTASTSFVDTTFAVIGSADATKKVRLEVDGLTTATTRVITPPDYDMKLGDGMIIATGRNIASRTNSVTPNSKIDITADELCVRDTNGTAKLLSTVSVTVDITASGANGLDTGSEASSTFYFGWVIAKADGTVAGLLSTSATAPTMPSGYTFKALATCVRNDGSSNFLKYRQFGNKVHYEAQNNVLNSGLVSTSEVTVSLSSFVPSIAHEAFLNISGHVAGSAGGSFDAIAEIRVISGSVFCRHRVTNVASTSSAFGYEVLVPNVSQQVFVRFTNTTNMDSSSFLVDVMGFKLPGGGE